VRDNKVVRRRRAVLALFVVASLILLTAYFGESPTSPLHQVQRGVDEVISPIQKGASKVLSPVSDLAGWVSSTLHAKSEVGQLRRDNQRLQDELAYAQQQVLEYRQAAQNVSLDVKLGISSSQRLDASVISQDPSLWYQTIEIGAGSDDGVQQNDPVIGDGALIGKVTEVDPTVSWVTLITDHAYSIAAEVQDQAGDRGQLVPQVGNPDQLLLEYLPSHALDISPGEEVVTAGFSDPSNPALTPVFPAGIPIGTVASFNEDELLNDGQVPVTPSADLRHLENVQVLVHLRGGTQFAAVGGARRAGTG
jgi:rod shape-determining protein MreC